MKAKMQKHQFPMMHTEIFAVKSMDDHDEVTYKAYIYDKSHDSTKTVPGLNSDEYRDLLWVYGMLERKLDRQYAMEEPT